MFDDQRNSEASAILVHCRRDEIEGYDPEGDAHENKAAYERVVASMRA